MIRRCLVRGEATFVHNGTLCGRLLENISKRYGFSGTDHPLHPEFHQDAVVRGDQSHHRGDMMSNDLERMQSSSS